MSGQKFYKPSKIVGWVVAIFDPRFNNLQALQTELVPACAAAGTF